MILYVDCNAAAGGDGSREKPFYRINDAAKTAMAGDEVIVAPGIYREDVNPIHGGKERARITYRSEQSRKAVITGADVFADWEQYDGDVWQLRVPNSYCGSFNPYTEYVLGDWLDVTVPVHRGEVFIGGRAMYDNDTL